MTVDAVAPVFAPALPQSLLDADLYRARATIMPEPRPVQTIRVLHVINGEHYSGAERVQDLLALRLPECGYSADFVSLKPGRFETCRQAGAAEVFDVSMRSRFDLRPARRVARLIRQHGYQLVHTHTPRAALVGRMASALAGVPLVHHVHSPTAADSTRRWQNRFNTLTERASLVRVNAVIAVSQSLGRYIEAQGIHADRVHVVPNGVPVAGPLTKRLTPRGTWTIGTVALFRPRKGLEVLIEALALARGKGCDVRLRAVGGFETPDYEALIRRQVDHWQVADAIDWTGFTRDVPSELAQMDLFVLPSLFGEGLPMVVLEAMAAGVPTIATRVEGICEAIRDRVDGLLVAPGSAQEIAAALDDFASRRVDWSALRTSAHLRQQQHYSDQSMAAGVAQVYQRVLTS